jgi:signal transduction histidine kinase
MNHLPEEPAKLGSVAPTDAEIRLQALNHTKDKLMSIVGHDLRTAIGGVVSLVDMMDRCLEANNLDEAKRLNGLIRRASCDADDLLNDLVTWTRSHGQNIEFRLEFLDVAELIETETARMRVPSLRKNQTIRVVVSGTGKLRADRYMLQSILRNLLSNALKFSQTGGEVLVRAEQQNQQWQFSVSDQGVGMSPEIQELLLKIDNRKQQAGTSGEVGSGFGLLLCEEFVQRHGGRLIWESAPNAGSTFSFTIPELIG